MEPRAKRVVAIAAAVLVIASGVARAAELRTWRVAPPGHVPAALVVGRAVCSASTWLLTESRQLVHVRTDGTVAVSSVMGFAATDKPWGLACLSDGTLWTMAAARTLARIDTGSHVGHVGHVRERIDLQLPRIALFAVGTRLLFQQLPIVHGSPGLMTSPARQPYAVRPWAGLVVQRANTREEQLTQNLVDCGIGLGVLVPCWFANAMRFTISDGSSFRTIGVPWLRSEPVEPDAPIFDVALAPGDHFWLLARGRDPASGRRSGIRLVRARERGASVLSVDLKPAARALLTATEASCLLLASDGSLIAVVVAP